LVAKVVGRLEAGAAEKVGTSIRGKPVVTVVAGASKLANVVGRLSAGAAEKL
jgi:succinyl-CoA synthetase alpha subunit